MRKGKSPFSVELDIDRHKLDWLNLTEDDWKTIKESPILITINDWRELVQKTKLQSNVVSRLIGKPVGRRVSIGDIIHTEAFQSFVGELAQGGYPESSVFEFRLKNDGNKLVMSNIRVNDIPIGDVTLKKRGRLERERIVRVKFSPKLKLCLTCEKPFSFTRVNKMYCSTTCRGTMERRRNRARKRNG